MQVQIIVIVVDVVAAVLVVIFQPKHAVVEEARGAIPKRDGADRQHIFDDRQVDHAIRRRANALAVLDGRQLAVHGAFEIIQIGLGEDQADRAAHRACAI